MKKLTDYVGQSLEYMGGYPKEGEYNLVVGQKYLIKDIYGCCFLVYCGQSKLFGGTYDNEAVINHERFKKE